MAKATAAPKTTTKVIHTAELIDGFDKLIKQYTSTSSDTPTALREKLIKLKSLNPTVYKKEKIEAFLEARGEAIEKIVAAYMVAKMTEKYPLLDPAIYKMKRHIVVDSGNQVSLDTASTPSKKKLAGAQRFYTIRLFAKVDFEDSRYECELGRIEKQVRRQVNRWHDSRVTTTTTTFDAVLPKPPANILAASRFALGRYHSIIGEMYADSAFADIEIGNDGERPSLYIIWIPTLKSIESRTSRQTHTILAPRPEVQVPRSIDPALLINVGGNEYVVELYDIVEEEPIENLLREFTTGGTITKAPKK